MELSVLYALQIFTLVLFHVHYVFCACSSTIIDSANDRTYCIHSDSGLMSLAAAINLCMHEGDGYAILSVDDAVEYNFIYQDHSMWGDGSGTATTHNKKKFWNDFYLDDNDDSTWRTLSCGADPYFHDADGTPDNNDSGKRCSRADRNSGNWDKKQCEDHNEDVVVICEEVERKCTIGAVVGSYAYCLTPEVYTRDNAEAQCVLWGGHLVTISSNAIWQDIKGLPLWTCRHYEFYWIGATYTTAWGWYSGTPWSWEGAKTDTNTPASDKKALMAEISNNHEWKLEKHDDSGVEYVGLCEKLIANPCDPNPCQGTGVCTVQGSSYSCNCASVVGYTGPTCATDINECSTNTHSCNHGTCVNNPGSYTCTCNSGYTGQLCGSDIDECGTNTHSCSQGTCVNNPGSYTCTCNSGYTGQLCGSDIDECDTNADSCIHGTCVNNPGSYTCTCDSGWAGQFCGSNINECATPAQNDCQNGATCVNTPGSFTCTCESGWEGNDCGTNIDECSISGTTYCYNGATCTDTQGNYTCSCVTGWEADDCNTNIDECADPADNNCQNGATCVDTDGGYTCTCESGWENDDCSTNIDECSISGTTYCYNGATCTDTQGNYTCSCVTGWEADDCNTNIDECADPADNNCQNGATCVDTDGGYTCTCESGWENDDCSTNIDECSISGTTYCYNGATCTDTQGSYTCSCVTGWEADDCNTNIDECADPADNNCQNGATCVDTDGGYTCTCETGWENDDCSTNIDECADSANNDCQNGATCVDTQGDFTCTCETGWEGDDCNTNIDECVAPLGNDCQNGATCVDTDGGFTCTCESGWENDDCSTNIDECSISGTTYCYNGATCTDTQGSYTCSCVTGWEADDCNTNIDECADPADNNCQNGATCVDTDGGFSCTCVTGWEGDDCSTNIDECADSANNDCQNGATCVDTQGDFTCTCETGWEGDDCNTNIDECVAPLGNDCQNGATCVDTDGGFTCTCESGWEGDDCSTNIDECADQTNNNCQNGATCVDTNGSFTCTCESGWEGDDCNTDIDECTPPQTHGCQNGVCENYGGGYICSCTAGYIGTMCDTVDPCGVSNPCLNGAGCDNPGGSPVCDCSTAIGYEGSLCGDDIDECTSGTNPHQCAVVGTCQNTIGGYTCDCTGTGFIGTLCDIDNPCNVTPCLHNGLCTGLTGTVECDCTLTGYQGDRCADDVDECTDLLHECLNGGVCQNTDGSYTCDCGSDYIGDRCATDNPCTTAPCENSAPCDGSSGTAICDCSSVIGYDGATCGDDIDECTAPAPNQHQCVNGGDCQNTVGGYECNCASTGYNGMFCTDDIDECSADVPDNHQCLNGGGCENTIGSYTCDCSNLDYSGLFCEIAGVPTTQPSPTTVIEEATTAESQQSTSGISSQHAFTPTDSQQATTQADVQQATTQADLQQSTNGFSDAPSTLAVEVYTAVIATGCASPPAIYHAAILDGDYVSYVVYKCGTGFMFSDGESSHGSWCQVDLTWSLKESECIDVQCPIIMDSPFRVRDGDDYGYDAVLTFWCASGYGFDDGSMYATTNCLGNGQWSNEVDICITLTCVSFDYPPDVLPLLMKSFSYPTTNSDECDEPPVETCGSQQENMYGHCQDIIRCGPIPYYQYTSISVTDHAVGSIVEVTCDEAHRYVDGHITKLIECEQDTLTWQPQLPECTVITCPPVVSILHGTKNSTDATFGSEIFFTCDHGYWFPDQSTVTSTICTTNRTWSSHIPDCSEISCALPPETDIAIKLGSSTNLDAVIQYTCGGAVFQNGMSTLAIICGTDGLWSITSEISQMPGSSNHSDVDYIIMDCIQNACPPVPIIANAEVNGRNSSVGSSVTYTCHRGHRFTDLTNTKDIECLDDLSWSYDIEDCLEVHCDAAPMVQFATVGQVSTLVDSVLNYTCLLGHEYPDGLHSQSVICTDTGQWIGPPLQEGCEPIVCDEPPYVENGALSTTSALVYNVVITFTCMVGYHVSLGTNTINSTCMADGSWTEVGQCQLLQCPPLPVWSTYDVNSTDTIYQTSIAISCTGNATFPNNITYSVHQCGRHAQWEPDLLECQEPVIVEEEEEAAEAPSSMSVGILAICMMTFVFGSLIVLDLLKLFSFLHGWMTTSGH